MVRRMHCKSCSFHGHTALFCSSSLWIYLWLVMLVRIFTHYPLFGNTFYENRCIFKKVKEKKVIISNSDAMEFNDVFKTQTLRLEGAIWFAILLCLSILSRLKLISWVEDSRQNWPFETNWEREKTASRSRSMKYIDEVFTHDIFKMLGPLEK